MKSKVWKQTRLRILKKKWVHCEKCMSSKKLHVHHASYKKLWNEPDKHLFVLCELCHNNFHKKYWVKEQMLKLTRDFIWAKYKRKKRKRQLIKEEAKKKFKIMEENYKLEKENIISSKYKYL